MTPPSIPEVVRVRNRLTEALQTALNLEEELIALQNVIREPSCHCVLLEQAANAAGLCAHVLLGADKVQLKLRSPHP